jgi:glycosyltransferase involved in cell wall biosynthesis
MVARFEEQKDHHTLFHALAGLTENSWEVDLIGDGPLLSRARAEAEGLGIAGRVRFLGSRRDVAEQLAGAQGFLLISKWEGFPISILEAMRAGLPVIASAVGGIPESVTDDETGLLVPYRDPEGLRHRLARLIRDAGLRARLGASGRSRYEREFTLDHSFSKTLQVYREAAARA